MSELEKNETLLRTGEQGGLLEQKISEVASRIKALRLDMGLSTKDMAEKVEVTEEEYVKYEEGQEDFSFTFVYKVANLCGVEISELMEGTTPALREYAVTDLKFKTRHKKEQDDEKGSKGSKRGKNKDNRK